MTPKDSKTQASRDKVASRNASNTKQRSRIRSLLPPHFFKGLCRSKICPVYTHLENPKGKELKSPSPNANAGHPWPHFELRSLDRGRRKRISMELNKNNLCRLEKLAAAEQKKWINDHHGKKIDRVKFFLRRKKDQKGQKGQIRILSQFSDPWSTANRQLDTVGVSFGCGGRTEGCKIC